MSKNRILITGANGFIGKKVVEKFKSLDSDYEVFATCRNSTTPDVLSCELSDFTQVKSLMDFVKPTTIIHLAAKATVKHDLGDNIVQSNILPTFNLLELCPPKTHFIFASSILVYGDSTFDFFKGREDWNVKPTSLYGYTKKSCEDMIDVYITQNKLNATSLRFSATLGAGTTHGVFHDFCKKVKSDAPEFEIIGNPPGSTKPYTHIDDVIAIIRHFCDTRYHAKWDKDVCYHDKYNCCVNDSISNSQIAEIMMKELKINKPIKWLGEQANWKGDNKGVFVDTEELRVFEGFNFKYPDSVSAVTAAVKDVFGLDR